MKIYVKIFVYMTFLFFVASVPSPQQPTREEDTTYSPKIQEWIRRYESPSRAEWQKPDYVVEFMRLKPGDVVVDIGAGTGYFTRRFARVVGQKGHVVGLDVEPEMVRYMREDAKKHGLKNFEARVVRPDNPGIPPQFADVLFLCNTYHHIQNRIQYFARIRQSLKKGGRLIIVDFYKEKNIPVAPPEWMRVSMQEVIHEMKEAGYRLLRKDTFLPYQYILEFVPDERKN